MLDAESASRFISSALDSALVGIMVVVVDDKF